MLGVFKPEYLYRPSQVVRRFRAPQQSVCLPWGATLQVDPSDLIGRALHTLGVYDLALSETLWRLTEASDITVDAGANVGYTAALLSVRASEVLAFEPHPEVFKVLQANATRLPNVKTFNVALSDSAGCATLSDVDPHNTGMATLHAAGPKSYNVRAIRLDSLCARANLVKIDVEGHELPALRGAGALVGSARDIIFESHERLPNPLSDFLKERGYSLFAIRRALSRPLLSDVSAPPEAWNPPNYLATLDAGRAVRLMRPCGWRCLTARQQSPAPRRSRT